jgi:hypothetical protein
LPVAVIPPVSLQPATTREFLAARGAGWDQTITSAEDFAGMLAYLEESETDQRLELQVVASNNSQAAVEGELTLDVPDGWAVSSPQMKVALEPGGSESVRFTVRVPAATPEGNYALTYRIRVGGREYGVVLTPVRMAMPGLTVVDGSNCIREQFIVSPAQVTVHLIEAQRVADLRYAYVKGADEAIVETLRPFGFDFHLITDEELGHLDLAQFDVIVVGPNAYLIRDELRKYAARFLAFVQEGGTLIVQYQAYGYQSEGLAPFPIRYNEPHDRVTLPDAPVTILAPDYRLFHRPNPIQPSDFANWVRDRGLYFWGEWDQQYQPLLACADPGESPKEGGLVVGQYGAGTYVYCAYSFFRQLPAAVPGAFRLFANLLSLPATRIQEQVEFLHSTALFAPLNEIQLQRLAEIMTERRVEEGTVLAQQGEIGHDLFIVYQGEIEVLEERDGIEQVRQVINKGAWIGELDVLADIARPATLRARGRTHLLIITDTGFQTLLRQQPEVAIPVIKLITGHQAGVQS